MGLIVVAAAIAALQHTTHALFPRDQTSMLWGVFTGLTIGGFIFGWLKKPWQ